MVVGMKIHATDYKPLEIPESRTACYCCGKKGSWHGVAGFLMFFGRVNLPGFFREMFFLFPHPSLKFFKILGMRECFRSDTPLHEQITNILIIPDVLIRDGIFSMQILLRHGVIRDFGCKILGSDGDCREKISKRPVLWDFQPIFHCMG